MFKRKLVDLRREMPVLARHEGEWAGEYIHVDGDGKVVDRHTSHLICAFPDEGDFPYYQINRYRWEDGQTEELHLPAIYQDGRLWWNNDRINGSATELDERTVVLNWTRTGMSGAYLYEMIHISDDSTSRSRTWHWFKEDELVRRTLIKEHRVV